MDEERAARMAQWWLCVIEGYNDALMGKPIEHCMYNGQELIAWRHGWRSRAWAALHENRADPVLCSEVKSIPAGGHLVAVVPPETLGAEMDRIRDELKRFFGDNRRVALVRSGEIEFIHFADVSTEGASWAMEANT